MAALGTSTGIPQPAGVKRQKSTMAPFPKPKTKASKPPKPGSGKRKLTPQQVKELSANPSTRTKVPTSQLSPKLRAEREFNKAPVTPGSSLTNKQLNTAANAYATQQYAPQEAAAKGNVTSAQNAITNTSGWYDDYQKRLEAHRANVEQSGRDQLTAAQGLIGAAKGLDASTAPAGMSGENQQVAANAGNVRSTALGSWGTYGQAIAGANDRYASNLANVVAPGQKLSAMSSATQNAGKAQDQLNALMAQKAAAKTTYKRDQIATEIKNLLSAQALGLDVQKEQFDQALETAKLGNDVAKTKAATKTAARAKGQTVNQWGYSNAEWLKMPASQRQQIIKQQKIDNRSPSKPAAGTKPKPTKPVKTPSQQADIVGNIKTIRDKVTFYAAQGWDTPAIRAYLIGTGVDGDNKRSPKTYSAADVNVGINWAKPSMGYASPTDVKYLHGLGINLKHWGIPYTKPKASPVVGSGGSGKADTQ